MAGFSGQGKVLIGARQSNGQPGILRWLGNASVFRIAMSEDSVERKESYTGNRNPSRRMTRGRSAEITITFDEFSKESMAYALLGVNTAVAAAGAVTGYTFPTGAVVGDSLVLPAKNVSAVALKDSTGSPKTLTLNVNYSLDAFAGSYTLLDLTTGGPFTQPFKGDYTPGAYNQIGAFKALGAELYVRMEGVNTDDNSRVVCDVFRVRLTPSKQFDIINDDFNDFELGGSVLTDSTRLSSSADGQFYSLSLP